MNGPPAHRAGAVVDGTGEDRATVLRGVGAAYDTRSAEYVALFGRLDQHPAADRTLVSRWRDATPGRLLDAGCGPGTWVELLAAGDRQVVGVDLSAAFLAVGRRRRPATPFLQGSLTALPLGAGTIGGVLAWYSVIHTPPDALPTLLAELGRVLRPAGSLLLGFVDGEPGQSFPHAVVTAYSWSVDALVPLLAEAGLEVVEHHQRHDPGHRPGGALVARRPA
ncbi:Methyltransferase domain-containing protein [Friedmanniella luteola]|uniref:Methyltransferase domain-containing protein n=1 Tax=Friedmanniella luteola TaxID=546871 RepID=A0A1H1RRD6_9ACTN|nr:class I SAM-dependent methyltransferase [Friedmanniella luteola]SDS38224.1 Methyltransferase domain-containing protein [Friedmanniella luteola]